MGRCFDRYPDVGVVSSRRLRRSPHHCRGEMGRQRCAVWNCDRGSIWLFDEYKYQYLFGHRISADGMSDRQL